VISDLVDFIACLIRCIGRRWRKYRLSIATRRSIQIPRCHRTRCVQDA